MVQTVDFRGVPLCRVGEWNGLTGKASITADDLAAAVAAYGDQEVDRARVKIGHVSGMNTALGDGAPAFGWVENPRVTDDGTTLVGDLVDVPRKLAGVIGRAYRNVSVELRKNVSTPSGRTHPTVLSGLALLGASAPAVKGLDDLAALYASEAPGGGPEDDCDTGETITLQLGDALDTSPAVPDPSHGPRDSGADSPDQRGETTTEEDADMAFLSEARKALGLGEDVSEQDVLARISNLTALSDGDGDDNDTNGADGEDGEQGAAQKNHAPAPSNPDPAPQTPETVNVSKAAWEDTNTRLQKLEAEVAAKHQAEVIETALSQGRIVPAEREKWTVMLAENPDVIEKVITGLAPRVHMTETGADVALTAGAEDDDAAFKAWADRVGF